MPFGGVSLCSRCSVPGGGADGDGVAAGYCTFPPAGGGPALSGRSGVADPVGEAAYFHVAVADLGGGGCDPKEVVLAWRLRDRIFVGGFDCGRLRSRLFPT